MTYGIQWIIRHLPHACGGEPIIDVHIRDTDDDLPHACGGEPLGNGLKTAAKIDLPHACGGEPYHPLS